MSIPLSAPNLIKGLEPVRNSRSSNLSSWKTWRYTIFIIEKVEY